MFCLIDRSMDGDAMEARQKFAFQTRRLNARGECAARIRCKVGTSQIGLPLGQRATCFDAAGDPSNIREKEGL